MSESNQENKRVEDWLTQGRPRAIRTRGGIRTRGAAVPASGVTIKRIAEVSELLEQLKEDVPEVPWVVVVDGRVDAFAERVCLQARTVRADAKFWLVASERELPQGSPLAALAPLRLNPQDANDLRFLENLVADLVIVSAAPNASQEERLRCWLPHARYILIEGLSESLIEELRTSEPAAASKAEICLIKPEQ